jgi:hypothetical protein
MIPLSEATEERLKTIFSPELQREAAELLQNKCAEKIDGCENHTPERMERIRFSVLKLSKGDIKEMLKWIEHAHVDWRDLFMAAGFSQDIHAHKKWKP